MNSFPEGTLPIRLTIAGCGSIGLAALVAADLISAGIAIVSMVVLFGAHLISLWWTSRQAQSARRLVGTTLLFGIALWVVVRVAGSDLNNLGPILCVALVGITIIQAATITSKRDVVASLALAIAMLVLSAGTSTDVQVAVLCVFGMGMGLVALSMVHRMSGDNPPEVVISTTGPDTSSGSKYKSSIAVGVAISIGLAVFLVMPQPPAVSASTGLSGVLGDAGSGQDGSTARSVDGYSFGGMDLRATGDLPDTPMWSVPQGSPSLWRSTVLDTYTNGGWTTSAVVQARTVPGLARFPGSRFDLPASGPTRVDTAIPSPDYSGAIISPGQMVSVESSMELSIQDTGDAISVTNFPHPSRYTVTSAATLSVADAAEQTMGRAEPTDAGRFLMVPPSVTPRVKELGRQLVASATSRADAVSNVERYLEDNAEYTLDAPVAARDQDPVDFFLFESHLGYCEHFAAAEALLLRSGGIPTRVATGFGYGVDAPDGRRTYRGVDAHAWVEVWMPGVGWASSDPTLGVPLAGANTNIFQRAQDWLAKQLDDQSARLIGALGIMMLLGLSTLGWLLMQRWRRRRSSRPAEELIARRVGLLEPVASFARLEHVLEQSGAPRAVAETPTELAERLPGQPSPALITVEQACYGLDRPSDADCRTAANALTETQHRIVDSPRSAD